MSLQFPRIKVFWGVLAYKSKSIWPSTFLHAAHNHFDQGIFGILTAGEDKMLYVSETGILTIVCAWILAAVMLASVIREKSREAA